MPANSRFNFRTPSKILKSLGGNSADRIGNAQVKATVEEVIADIRLRGDKAVRDYSKKFDNHSADSYLLSNAVIDEVMARVPKQVIDDITFVQTQVRWFAEHQLASLKDFEVETHPGVFLGQKNVPIESTGAYIPGGKYPLLASAHMTIVTAKVAGVKRVVACTPLIKGEMPDATIAAMKLAGADEIYILGGIQAIAAMAIGTETIAPVAMIAGPGNAFVAEAKRQLFGEVGIDLFAGPTEILIVADESADPFIVAVDLLSQAEHVPDSPAILITTDESLGHQVSKYVDEILVDMPTKDYAEPAWRDWGAIHVVANINDAFALAD